MIRSSSAVELLSGDSPPGKPAIPSTPGDVPRPVRRSAAKANIAHLQLQQQASVPQAAMPL
jgi:hypothetical protein